MCFGGSKQPSVTQEVTPLPAPTPIPTAADPNPALTADQKRARIAALKYGAMSTIKTSGQGITGSGANLSTPAAQGKQTLGA